MLKTADQENRRLLSAPVCDADARAERTAISRT